MTSFTPSSRPFARRTAVALLALWGLVLAGWMASDLPAQNGPAGVRQKAAGKPPRKKRHEEEEEEDDPRPKKVIRVEGDDDKGKPRPRPRPETRPAVPATDLAKAAEKADNPAVKELFRKLAVPHDVITTKPSTISLNGEPQGSQDLWVAPIPQYPGADGKSGKYPDPLQVSELYRDGRPYKVRDIRRIEKVEPYEKMARETVHDFLAKSHKDLPRLEQLQAAERALASVLRFHQSARDRGVRAGPGWDAVKEGLRRDLLDVLLDRLKGLAEAKDWDQAFALTRQLARTYPEARDQARIAKPLADFLQKALESQLADFSAMREARQRLVQLKEEFPDSEDVKAINESLQKMAQALLDKAKELETKDPGQSQDLYRQAEETWPTLPTLQAFRQKIVVDYPILRVGVRNFPDFMSPHLAWTDSELRAVELLFEGLVKVSPDAQGVLHYHSALAQGRPRIVPLGRQFQLPIGAVWSDGKPLNAVDVRYSVEQLRQGYGGRSAAWRDLVQQVAVLQPFRADISLTQGYLDPLALMTFKVVPHHLKTEGEDFARSPVGSGPFKLSQGLQAEEGTGRKYLRFVANPFYGSRPGKFGRPRFREIRFYQTKDPVAELNANQLDLALDLTAKEAATLNKQRTTPVMVQIPKASVPNRRVYFLAVNHRKAALADVKVRRALAHAIDREKLLDDHFRGGLNVHRALNGPYPAGSWACDPKLKGHVHKDSLDPYDVDLAKSQMNGVQVAGPLTLLYPNDDPAVEAAMRDLAEQVKKVGIELQPSGVSPHDLRRQVERGAYDLAYYRYDFPDDTYWLWPLLGPTGRTRGENFLGNRDRKKLLPQVEGIVRYRDFTEVRKRARLIHGVFYGEMPFIPLWQLDPLSARRNSLQPVPFDAVLVFTDVEEWKLSGR